MSFVDSRVISKIRPLSPDQSAEYILQSEYNTTNMDTNAAIAQSLQNLNYTRNQEHINGTRNFFSRVGGISQMPKSTHSLVMAQDNNVN